MKKEEIEQEFKLIRQSSLETSINILAIRTALVDKGVCTEGELKKYTETARQAINNFMLQGRDQMISALREELGDEVADDIESQLNKKS